MNRGAMLSLLCTAFISAACSTTPGDAAYRSGQKKQAADLYRMGAEQGDGLAALKLGLLISADKNSTPAEATQWYVKACDLGNMVGCHNAGVAYEQNVTAPNYELVRTLYEKAAEKGYMQSQYNLGSLYANQYFNNDVEGLKWLLLAQRNARSCMKEDLCQWILNDPPGHTARLKKRMSVTDIKSAEALASHFVTT